MRGQRYYDAFLMELLYGLYQVQHIALVASEGKGIYADHSRVPAKEVLDVGLGTVGILYGYAYMARILVS